MNRLTSNGSDNPHVWSSSRLSTISALPVLDAPITCLTMASATPPLTTAGVGQQRIDFKPLPLLLQDGVQKGFKAERESEHRADAGNRVAWNSLFMRQVGTE